MLPASGTLSVENLSNAQVLTLPATFVGTEGLGNLQGWALRSGDGPVPGRRILVRDGRIYIQKKGIVVSLR